MKIGVAGSGRWGRNLVRTFHQLGALAAVAEEDPAAREALLAMYPGVPVYGHFNDLLRESHIDGLVIATPAPTHYPLARAALLAGKDLFVEKPMTLSRAHAEELVEIARREKRILMVGHLLLYQPAVQWVKQYISSGAMGKLCLLQQERLKLGNVRSAEDVLWSFGVHDLAVLLYLTGRKPEKIRVSKQCVIQPKVADNVYLHLEYGPDLQAHLHFSWLWPEQRRCLTIVGSEAMLVYNELEQSVVLHRKGIASGLLNRDEGSEVVFRGSGEPLRLECQHFLEALEGRTSPLSDGINGLEVVDILEKASLGPE